MARKFTKRKPKETSTVEVKQPEASPMEQFMHNIGVTWLWSLQDYCTRTGKSISELEPSDVDAAAATITSNAPIEWYI